ncbi:MAG: biotin--[acetyl-CoA-carboxylase] ligase [Planctomycetes bacterium]|nr:biotin--[acetyl-CoA-carboxylase] ligase [Planctomycetota bacterium]
MIDIPTLLAESFVRQAQWHSELASTNSRALELAADLSVVTPLLIGATTQTAGRGRGTNRWWAGDGTLMFSILFDMPRLGLPQSEWPRFSLATALSIAETIEAFLPNVPVGLKWPNDVWLGNRKTCGILIEQSDRSPGRLVVGIGLNINTQFADAPDDLRAIATSLYSESGQKFPLSDVLFRLLQRWDINIAAQRSGDWNLQRLWSRLCVLKGRQVRVTAASGETTGLCQGIADDGALLILEGNQVIRCYAGTVRTID